MQVIGNGKYMDKYKFLHMYKFFLPSLKIF